MVWYSGNSFCYTCQPHTTKMYHQNWPLWIFEGYVRNNWNHFISITYWLLALSLGRTLALVFLCSIMIKLKLLQHAFIPKWYEKKKSITVKLRKMWTLWFNSYRWIVCSSILMKSRMCSNLETTKLSLFFFFLCSLIFQFLNLSGVHGYLVSHPKQKLFLRC